MKEAFPELYGCSLTQNVTIESVLVCPRHGFVLDWNVAFGRGFNDWELDLVMSFFTLLHSLTRRREDTNKLK